MYFNKRCKILRYLGIYTDELFIKNLILENILSALITSTGKWLPGINFSNLGEGGNPDLSYKHSMAISLAYLIIGGAIAALLFKRRDVAN
jgi:ABC-type transport system involved in multi-copper enzyme maturation permease subunit